MKRYDCFRRLWKRTCFLAICMPLLILATPENCLARSYFYDELNRLEKIVYDDGTYITYSYDSNGNMKENKVENRAQNEESGNSKDEISKNESSKESGDTSQENGSDHKDEIKPGKKEEEKSTSGGNEEKKDTTIVGKRIKSKSATYQITSVGKNRTVTLMKLNHNKYKKYVISDTIKYKGKSYKITGIADNALKKQTKLKSVTIGKNISVIGKNAFYGDKELKDIMVKSVRLKTIGKNAFRGINKNAIIKVPDKKYMHYKKLWKGKGQRKTVQIKKTGKA